MDPSIKITFGKLTKRLSVRQTRMKCPVCEGEWWYTPGSVINPRDHDRPDGKPCSWSVATVLPPGWKP
jgi:hypothetical protein